ncbi:tryptophan synthase subunit alpha [Streptomonospora litoralis]|uniref:Tryptophan synthase alpha chain n=1 Tax=Streptomonospora litoralis TaxID=2498135 RepID=A0A4P6Q7U2_9ACTN|nr:tryptophan synthase subunit alpha [Streptomonospora litoralis]QBI54927.1 Tryptophan synthase alpha chain [Streptomonospora litoralis]
MADFFSHRPAGRVGLAVFLNAGDPPLDVLADVVHMLDEAGVECLELAVPFPDSVTDGPVVQRSARRALDRGTDLDAVLAFVSRIRPRLARMRIALLADWSHSLSPRGLGEALGDVAESGADALLTHALPPRMRDEYYRAARESGVAVVTTCYPQSRPEVAAEAAANATGYLYLVARYGRSGTGPVGGHAALAGTVRRLRESTAAPIALGFGVRTRADVAAVAASGADAAVIGSAGVTRVEEAQEQGADPAARLREFVLECRPPLPDQTAQESANSTA